jgi:hypothetical protein
MSAIMQAARARLEAFSTAAVSSRTLGMLRVFGVVTIYTQLASPWVSHRIDDSAGTLLLSQLMFMSATLLIFGFKTRIAALVCASCFGGLHLYYGGVQGMEKLAAPVFEFQFLVLLALTPCGRSLSVDRALAVRRAHAEGREPPPERVPWWQLELFVLLIASVLFWSAVDCSQERWLSGLQIEQDLMRLWSGSELFRYRPRVHTIAVALAWTVTICCYVLAFGLLIRRWRPYLVWLAVALLMAALFTFAYTYVTEYYTFIMLASLIACLDPERVHRFITLQGEQPALEEAP